MGINNNHNDQKKYTVDYEILKIVKDYIGQDIDEKSSLSDLNIDSIILVKIILKLEKTFNFQFDDQMLTDTNFPTVKSFILYVKNKIITNEM